MRTGCPAAVTSKTTRKFAVYRAIGETLVRAAEMIFALRAELAGEQLLQAVEGGRPDRAVPVGPDHRRGLEQRHLGVEGQRAARERRLGSAGRDEVGVLRVVADAARNPS